MTMLLEQRYDLLQKRLEHLNYPHTFGIESLQLVEILVDELLETKQVLQDLNYRMNKDESTQSELYSKWMGLKKEYAKQTKDNSQLRSQLPKEKERFEMMEQSYQQQIKKLERSLDDVKLLQAQWSSMIQGHSKSTI
jgi:predicted RNase H-like nuclease (RuvC/YqgF family)